MSAAKPETGPETEPETGPETQTGAAAKTGPEAKTGLEAETGPMPALQLRLGYPAAQQARAAEIYWSAFGDKLQRVLGPKPRALQLLQLELRADHCVAALDGEGHLLGLAGFKTPKGSFTGSTPEEMRRIYGWFGAAWRLALLRLLVSDIDNQRFLVDGIAVAEEARGQGIGTALVRALCQEAQARGYSVVRLEVVDTNLRAQQLYLREGFVTASTAKMGWLRHVFGFRAAMTMVLDLQKLRQPRGDDAGLP